MKPLLRLLVLLWHRARSHRVRDLGEVMGHRRIWCYDCRADLVDWPPNRDAPPFISTEPIPPEDLERASRFLRDEGLV